MAFFNRLSASRGACFFGVWAGPGRGLPTGEHIEIPRVAGGVVDGHVQIVPLDFKAEVNFQIVLPLGEIAGAGPGTAAVVHQPLVGAAAEAERVDHKNVERAERVGGALRVFFALGVIRHQGVHPPVLRGQRAGGPVVGGADIVAHQIARGVHPGQHFPFVAALKQEGVGQRVVLEAGAVDEVAAVAVVDGGVADVGDVLKDEEVVAVLRVDPGALPGLGGGYQARHLGGHRLGHRRGAVLTGSGGGRGCRRRAGGRFLRQRDFCRRRPAARRLVGVPGGGPTCTASKAQRQGQDAGQQGRHGGSRDIGPAAAVRQGGVPLRGAVIVAVFHRFSSSFPLLYRIFASREPPEAKDLGRCFGHIFPYFLGRKYDKNFRRKCIPGEHAERCHPGCAPLMVERQRDGLSRWSGRSSPFPMFNPSMYRLYRCGEHGKQMIASGMSQMISGSRNRARYRSTCSLVRLQKFSPSSPQRKKVP